jgi:hypothetical protein
MITRKQLEYRNINIKPILVADSYAEALNTIIPGRFKGYKVFNAEVENMKVGQFDFKPAKVNETIANNDHYGNHVLRKYAENKNYFENIHGSNYNGIQIPHRPILDVMATRIAMGGNPCITLIPNTEHADNDRMRTVRNDLMNIDDMLFCDEKAQEDDENMENDDNADAEEEEEQEEDNDEKEDDKRADNLKIDIGFRFTNNIVEGTLQEFTEAYTNHGTLTPEMNELGYNSRDLLINLTDVDYYIPTEDMFKIAKPLADGTIIMGLKHTVNNLDTNQHPIRIGDRVEGFVQLQKIAPEYTKKYNDKMKIMETLAVPENEIIDQNNLTMFMCMNGNNQVYHHKHEVTTTDFCQKQNLMSSPNYPFVLKRTIRETIPLGGVSYNRYTIEKISRPSLHNLLTPAVMTNPTNYRVIKQYYDEYEKELDKELTLIPNNKTKAAERDKVRAKHLNKLITRINTQLSIKLPGKQEKVRDVETSKYKVQSEQDGSITIISKRNGRLVSYYEKYYLKQLKVTEEFVNSVSSKLIQKVITKAILAPKIDSAFIRSLVSYINREDPSLDVNNTIIPIILHALQQTQKSEMYLNTLLQSKDTALINEMKAKGITLSCSGIVDAYQKGRLTEYLGMKIRDIIGLNTETFLDDKTPRGFI